MIEAWLFLKGLLGAAWAILKAAVTIPLGVLLAAALAGLTLGSCHAHDQFKAGYAKGEAHERAAWQKVARKLHDIRASLEQVGARISTLERQRLDRALVDNHTHFTNLRREVRTHVTPAADARCVVPLGFVRELNKGIAGRHRRAPEISGGAGRPDDAASGLALSDVADQLLGGFEAPYAWRAELDAWRRWYPAECAAWRRAGGVCDDP